MSYDICKFAWAGRDGKDHYCSGILHHAGNLHICDCGDRKYAGPDPTAWRKKAKLPAPPTESEE